MPETASLREIQTAYRRRAFELHPDRNGSTPESVHHFQLLNDSYRYLMDHPEESPPPFPNGESRENGAGGGESFASHALRWLHACFTSIRLPRPSIDRRLRREFLLVTSSVLLTLLVQRARNSSSAPAPSPVAEAPAAPAETEGPCEMTAFEHGQLVGSAKPVISRTACGERCVFFSSQHQPESVSCSWDHEEFFSRNGHTEYAAPVAAATQLPASPLNPVIKRTPSGFYDAETGESQVFYMEDMHAENDELPSKGMKPVPRDVQLGEKQVFDLPVVAKVFIRGKRFLHVEPSGNRKRVTLVPVRRPGEAEVLFTDMVNNPIGEYLFIIH